MADCMVDCMADSMADSIALALSAPYLSPSPVLRPARRPHSGHTAGRCRVWTVSGHCEFRLHYWATFLWTKTLCCQKQIRRHRNPGTHHFELFCSQTCLTHSVHLLRGLSVPLSAEFCFPSTIFVLITRSNYKIFANQTIFSFPVPFDDAVIATDSNNVRTSFEKHKSKTTVMSAN